MAGKVKNGRKGMVGIRERKGMRGEGKVGERRDKVGREREGWE